MTIFSSFSANFPPHYQTILAINCVHASNWFTHLQQTRQIDGQNDNSVLIVSILHAWTVKSADWLIQTHYSDPLFIQA